MPERIKHSHKFIRKKEDKQYILPWGCAEWGQNPVIKFSFFPGTV